MLYIIRHGETAKNKKKLLQGRSDQPLNDKGLKQSAEAGKFFRAEGIIFDHVYSSPLIRAVQTAGQILGEDSDRITIDDRLIEMDYGPYEGMDLEHPAPEVMAFFMDFAGTRAPEGMEQLEEVTARLGDFLEDIIEEARSGNVLISTHAIAMKGALEYLTPESKGSYWSEYIGNCDVYAAEVTDSGYGIPYPLKQR